MLEAVVNAVRPTAEHKGVRLVTAFDASADTPLLADRKKIQKVALNLLANAVRYTPQGGTVTLSAGTADGALRFAVADTGIGMGAMPKKLRGADGVVITEGVIWKQLLAYFFPILFGTFFQQLYNTADAMVPLVGFKSTSVYYERAERIAGESHYPLKKMLALAFDGITSLTVQPIRIITGFGAVVSLLGFIGVLWALIAALCGATVAGWASTVCIVCFLGGVQLLSLGVIGEYVGKIYMYQSHLQQLILWQMGSFSGRSWPQLAVLAPVTLAGVLALCFFAREMDLLSFSEERARALGVETRRVKWILIVLASLLTGTAVCFTGIIGFVDLIAPHAGRVYNKNIRNCVC